jgi:hypothetical protein
MIPSDDDDLVQVARNELSAIIAWVRNTYIEDRPMDVEPTDEEVMMAIRSVTCVNDHGADR